MLNAWAKRITDDFDRTKEQLNETTRLVQEIQREVHLKTTGELFILNQRRTAVVEFFVTNRRILFQLFVMRPNNAINDPLKEEALNQFLDHSMVEMQNSKAKLDLFVNDDSLINLAGKLGPTMFEMVWAKTDHLSELKSLVNSIHKMDSDTTPLNDFEKQVNTSKENHSKHQIERYNKGMACLNGFIKEARRYLDSLN